MESQPIRITKPVDRGTVILSYDAGVSDEPALLNWLTQKAPQVTTRNVGILSKNMRHKFDPDGTLSLKLEFISNGKESHTMHSRHYFKGGGSLVMDLNLPNGAKLDRKARAAFMTHARNFKPTGNASQDRSNAIFIRDELWKHGHLTHQCLRNVRYVPPRNAQKASVPK